MGKKTLRKRQKNKYTRKKKQNGGANAKDFALGQKNIREGIASFLTNKSFERLKRTNNPMARALDRNHPDNDAFYNNHYERNFPGWNKNTLKDPGKIYNTAIKKREFTLRRHLIDKHHKKTKKNSKTLTKIIRKRRKKQEQIDKLRRLLEQSERELEDYEELEQTLDDEQQDLIYNGFNYKDQLLSDYKKYRKIPYKKRTKKQRKEKDRIMKQLHKIEARENLTPDSLSSYDYSANRDEDPEWAYYHRDRKQLNADDARRYELLKHLNHEQRKVQQAGIMVLNAARIARDASNMANQRLLNTIARI